MFTDVDHYEEELRDILSNGMPDDSPIWIISNPDFEIWLYFCFRNNPDIDLADVAGVVPSQRSSKLKEVNGTFNKGGGLDTRKAFEHLKDGIVHSKEHYQQDEYGVPVLFSTQMHLFAEDVLAELGNEYDEWMKKKQAFRNSKKKADDSQNDSQNDSQKVDATTCISALTDRQKKILTIIDGDRQISAEMIGKKLKVSTATVYRDIKAINKVMKLYWKGPSKGGHWTKE